jgi:PAS domain S-box-containing protein
MSETGSLLSILHDARFAPHATASLPAWLWSSDGSRLLWANPTGAAIFGFGSPSACAARAFGRDQLAAAQIARLAGTLALGAPPRLEMLRGFGAGLGRTLLCQCARVALDDRTATLIVATQPAGPNFSLAERARRLLAGIGEAAAAYTDTADRRLIAATEGAEALLAGRNSLAAIGADPLGASVQETGCAQGASEAGALGLMRIGSAPNTLLLAIFEDAPAVAAARPAVVVVSPAVEQQVDTMPDAPQERRTARRHPLRFIWQMDAQNRFSLSAGEFADLVGVTPLLSRPWEEIAAALGLGSDDEVARAVASRDTWSGIPVDWPVRGADARVRVELSGLPIYDRDRMFRGYRGFGVCRDVARLDEVLKHGADQAHEKAPAAPERPALTVAAGENVLPFPRMTESTTGTLSPGERNAFSELARQLTARLRSAGEHLRSPAAENVEHDEHLPEGGLEKADGAEQDASERPAPAAALETASPAGDVRPLLQGMTAGVLIHRHGQFLYANQAFLDWTGHKTLSDFEQAGGLDSLLLEGGRHDGDARSLVIETPRGDRKPAQARLFTIPWDGATAMALMLQPTAADKQPARQEPPASGAAPADELRELRSILDAAADGILVLDGEGKVLRANHGAQTLLGYDAAAFGGMPFADLFAPDSKDAARDDLHRVSNDRLGRAINEGREMTARARRGDLVPLLVTITRLNDGAGRFCAVLRDVTQWKKHEQDLVAAKTQAEQGSSAKSEFLAKISHEIRTPLNAIIGFSEVMMNERFGPVGNERYRDYLKDIHESGGHLVSLLNDLLDLSKIEAGKLELTFDDLNLNDITQQSVAMMQPEANRERIIIRTSLPTSLPQVKADARSLRQIILNLLSNSIKFTGAGGQVIVSTAVNDNGDVVLRVRDTGAGMSEKDIAVALEPFRQLTTTTARTNIPGTGLGLPLTKALAEANRARFSIRRADKSGTLVEVAFSKARIPAE